MQSMQGGVARRWRTIFLSDVHLGYRGCQADALLGFLRAADTDVLVLVGDIVDLWSLSRSFYWPAAHHAVLRELVAIANSGTRVLYIPGNHDGAIREFCGAEVAGIEVRRDWIFESADGRRYLVLHGDDFDGAVTFSGWLRHLGEHFYDVILALGRHVHWIRRRLGYGHWSLATWVKGRIPDARRYIERFEQAAARAAGRVGLDGVICGHIHRPVTREVDGLHYCNDGDWVEHCTALVEHRDGRLEILWCAGGAAGAAATPLAPSSTGWQPRAA